MLSKQRKSIIFSCEHNLFILFESERILMIHSRVCFFCKSTNAVTHLLICKIFTDQTKFLIRKNFNMLSWSRLHPGMSTNAIHRKPFGGIRFKKTTKKGLQIFWKLVRSLLFLLEGIFTLDYQLVEVTHIARLERNCTKKHSIEANSKTPDIWCEASVARAACLTTEKDLWCDVGWCSTLFSHYVGCGIW